MKKTTAPKTMFAMRFARTAPLNARPRKTESATSGERTRRSMRTKAPISSTAPPR